MRYLLKNYFSYTFYSNCSSEDKIRTDKGMSMICPCELSASSRFSPSLFVERRALDTSPVTNNKESTFFRQPFNYQCDNGVLFHNEVFKLCLNMYVEIFGESLGFWEIIHFSLIVNLSVDIMNIDVKDWFFKPEQKFNEILDARIYQKWKNDDQVSVCSY